jgi:transposase-like protein
MATPLLPNSRLTTAQVRGLLRLFALEVPARKAAPDKGRLLRYRGVRRSHFGLYLKEMEWRFNHRNDPLAKLLERLLLDRDLD